MPDDPISLRLNLSVRLSVSGGDHPYWVARTPRLHAYGVGDTPALAVEDCLEDIVERAKIFREDREKHGGGSYPELEDWEAWCGR